MNSETPAPARLMSFIQRSPAVVAAHDRVAWLALFADDAVVTDPVGTTPHVGIEQIGRFYDTFIAANQIDFEVSHDIVCGNTVIRDATLHTTMWGGAELHVPVFLRYELSVDRSGELHIDGLSAYWELPAMLAQLRATGVRGAVAAARLGPALVGNQGVGGAIGFARGLDRVGEWAKSEAAAFADGLRRADPDALAARLAPDAVLEQRGLRAELRELGAALPGARWAKMIVAGYTVAMALQTEHERAVLLLEFGARRAGIGRVRLYR